MCEDALAREESCGCHARLEHLTEAGEAKRDDKDYAFVSAWEWSEDKPVLHKEFLHFEFIQPTVRNYK